MSVLPAGSRSPPTVTATGSIAPTSAMCRPGFKGVQRHDEGTVQPGNPLPCQSRTFPATVDGGTQSDYAKIDTILEQKYRPIFVDYMPRN